MPAMASCFCGARSAARGQVVKLVFPGGHVELLDRPVLAAEVMARHPRFCVARTDVFRVPVVGAVAAPDTMLHLGRKYFVVPRSTLRKLIKCPHSSSSSAGGGSVSLRRHLAMDSAGGHDGRGYKVGGKKQHKWFSWGAGGAQGETKLPQRPQEEGASRHGSDADAAAKEVHARDTRVKAKGATGGSTGRRRRRRCIASPADSASYSWQPSLHSITEE